MLLKRVFDQAKLIRDKDGKVTEVLPGAVLGVLVKRADHGKQCLSPEFISGGIMEGWLTIVSGENPKVVITTMEGDDLTYLIVRAPGHYCSHCDHSIDDGNVLVETPEGKRTKGQLAVAKYHPGVASPDPQNPAGYRKENYYTLLNEAVTVNLTTREEAAAFERDLRDKVAKKIPLSKLHAGS